MQLARLMDRNPTPRDETPGEIPAQETGLFQHPVGDKGVEPRTGRIERYEGSDEHVYLIEYLDDRYVARTFAGDVYVSGSLSHADDRHLSEAQVARIFAINEIEEKIKACRALR